MAGGAATQSTRVCVVGSRSLRDFHASLCAANLSRAGIEARGIEIEIDVDRADENALGLSKRFDDPAWRAGFAARLAIKLGADELVGLPAMLGARDPHGAWSDLEHRLGRLILGAEVVAAERAGHTVSAVSTHAGGQDVKYAAPCFVLAAGGFASGAIELDSRWTAHDRVLGLPLRGLPGPDEPRFVPDYFAEQPMARVGVAVDAGLRAEGAENVLVVGAALPGAMPWREASGEGIALATGSRAAQTILAGAGAPAGAAA
jgi:glycerol-3-phosphate dehydrogenase subunit B